jgi:hypothetical protein
MRAIAFWIIVASVAAFTYQRLAVAQSREADFSVIVKTTDQGVELTCRRGCAWTTLTFACEEKRECEALVDARGVRGAR